MAVTRGTSRVGMLAVVAAVLVAGALAQDPNCVCNHPTHCDCCGEHGCFIWEIPETDCMPGDELGNCSSHPPPYTIQECEDTCRGMPNCGGFNLPNGHLKRLGCTDEMVPWPALAPSKEHPEGRPALTLFAMNHYPARREYWWKLPAQNCNNRYNELGNCTMTNPHPNPTPAQKAEFEKEYLAHCKSVCQANPFCEGFNLPTGHLKAMGCRDDFIHSGATLYLRRGHPQARDPAATTLHHMEKMDCAPGFELGNCSSYLPPPYSVSECTEACKKNPLCGGFNLPNGHLKTADCAQEIQTSTNQDLYVFTNEP